MKAWVRYLLEDSLVYGIGYGLSRFLQVIILPIIATALTLSEFGYYSNFVILYTILGGFFVLGLDSAVARFFYDSHDKSYHQKLFSTSFLFILLVSLGSILFLFQFQDLILNIIAVPLNYKQSLPLVLYCIPVVTLNNFFLSWFKWKRQKIFFLFNSSLTIILLLVPLMLAKTVSLIFIFHSIFWSQLLVAILSTALASNYIKFSVDKTLLKALLKYGFPWMLVFVFGISRTYLDRIFLTHYLDENTYGVYNFSVRIATLLSIIITAFDMSFGPLAFSIWKKKEAPVFFSRLQSIYILIISSIACWISILSPFLISLLGGAKFNGAERILPFLLFAAIPISLINFSNLGTAFAKKSFLSTAALFCGFAVVLILNILLTPYYFQYGAVIASMVGHLIMIIVGYAFSKKYYPIAFAYIKDAAIYLLFFLLSIMLTNFSVTKNVFYNITILTVCLVTLVALLVLSFFRDDLKKIFNSGVA